MCVISENFQKIKEKFKISIKRIGLSFDDDIFSDTIIKCNNKLSSMSLTKQEMISYFWIAFKTNTLRDIGYLRNKTTDEIPEEIYDEEYIDDTLFDDVSKEIINTFGEELYQLFSLHANGMDYEQLKKISDRDDLKYKFRRIREHIRNKFSN